MAEPAEVHLRTHRGISAEHVLGGGGVLFGDVPVGVVPVVHRQRVVVDADPGGVLVPLAQQHRPSAGGDGVVEAIEQVALLGEQLEELGLVRLGVRGTPFERGLEERGRLRVGAGPGGRPPGRGGMTEHAVGIAGADRVVGEDRGVGVR